MQVLPFEDKSHVRSTCHLGLCGPAQCMASVSAEGPECLMSAPKGCRPVQGRGIRFSTSSCGAGLPACARAEALLCRNPLLPLQLQSPDKVGREVDEGLLAARPQLTFQLRQALVVPPRQGTELRSPRGV